MMNNKINIYVNNLFAPYEEVSGVIELKQDLMVDLQERYQELLQEGKDEEIAVNETIISIGDIEETIKEMANHAQTDEKSLKLEFNASALEGSDFANVTMRDGKLNASDLKDADFTNAKLHGCTFKSSNLQGAKFDSANLTQCNFSVSALNNVSFVNTILDGTTFSKSGMDDAVFKNSKIINVDFSVMDLRKVKFVGCTIDGGSFQNSDLTGQSFDQQMIKNIQIGKAALKNASFQGATLKNVSFKPRLCVTNKYYKAIATIKFNGTFMDKLTYNSLKSLGANLENVTIL